MVHRRSRIQAPSVTDLEHNIPTESLLNTRTFNERSLDTRKSNEHISANVTNTSTFADCIREPINSLGGINNRKSGDTRKSTDGSDSHTSRETRKSTDEGDDADTTTSDSISNVLTKFDQGNPNKRMTRKEHRLLMWQIRRS